MQETYTRREFIQRAATAVVSPVAHIDKQTTIEDEIAEKKQLVTWINKDILATRELFLEEERNMDKVDLTYNYEHDQQPYITLAKYRDDKTGAYTEVKKALDSFTTFQLDTLLRERFGALSSKWKFVIKDDGLYSENGTEPVRNMFKRGQQYRENHGSNEVDREKGEVEGFISVTEPMLMNPHTPEGTSMLVISGPGKKGSIYGKNFYDIFTVRRDDKGTRYIEARRYSSALKGKEYFSFIQKLNPHYQIPKHTNDEVLTNGLLRAPIVISHPDFPTGEAIHRFIHKEHTYTNEDKMEHILKAVGMLKQRYLAALQDAPHLANELKRRFNAILNGADEVATKYDTGDTGLVDTAIIFDAVTLERLETQKTREVMTDCGRSVGFGLDDPFMSPLERALRRQTPNIVADMGILSKAEDDPNLCRCNAQAAHFHCPGKEGKTCNHAITVGKGITTCPSCGAGKRC